MLRVAQRYNVNNSVRYQYLLGTYMYQTHMYL